MAICIACGTSLPDGGTCRPCRAGGRVDIGTIEVANLGASSWSVLEPEMTITLARLTAPPGQHVGSTGDRRRRSVERPNALAVSALIVGVGAVFMGLLGQGWFGIPTAVYGHWTRRRVSRSPDQGGGATALAGLGLGYAAIAIAVTGFGR